MSDHVEVVLDQILADLDDLVAAKNESAVRDLQAKIEDAIHRTGKELILAIAAQSEVQSDREQFQDRNIPR